MTGARVVAAAREWIGTPYCHQQSTKGAGCDCLGLLRGVWREVRGAEPESVPPYSPDWSEAARDERLWCAAARHLLAVPGGAPLQPGDVILFRMRAGAVAKHLGIVAEAGAAPTFVHAYTGHGVVESPLAVPWRRRIAARFRISEGVT
ncbi:MAG: peptidase [Rhodobacteraceae bacterium]|nr:peptidase [Paracoccaceae bacterium]